MNKNNHYYLFNMIFWKGIILFKVRLLLTIYNSAFIALIMNVLKMWKLSVCFHKIKTKASFMNLLFLINFRWMRYFFTCCDCFIRVLCSVWSYYTMFYLSINFKIRNSNFISIYFCWSYDIYTVCNSTNCKINYSCWKLDKTKTH